jgi:hypothetical protein
MICSQMYQPIKQSHLDVEVMTLSKQISPILSSSTQDDHQV